MKFLQKKKFKKKEKHFFKNTMSVATYDRKKSKVKEEKLAEFIMGDLTEDLQSVPGVGPTTAKQLNDAGIDTSFALVGKFLMVVRQVMRNRKRAIDSFSFSRVVELERIEVESRLVL